MCEYLVWPWKQVQFLVGKNREDILVQEDHNTQGSGSQGSDWGLEVAWAQVTGKLGWQCCLHLVSSASGSPFSHSWTTESPTCSLSQSCSLPIQMETESMSTATFSFSTNSCTSKFMTPLQTWASHTCRISNISLYLLITSRPLGVPGERPAIRFLQVPAHLLPSSLPC